jgi:hypothetical protein
MSVHRFTVSTSCFQFKQTRYRINLPIYNSVVLAQIGVPAHTGVVLPDVDTSLPPSPTESAPQPLAPIVWYGTSIVNGHVASRPGMIFTAQLGRALGRSIINLGFGGNGEMEASVVRVVTELKQAAVVVIDCNWNMDPPHIRRNATSVVKQLRRGWSATKPIVLAEGTSAGHAWITPAVHAAQAARRAALAAAYTELIDGRPPSSLARAFSASLAARPRWVFLIHVSVALSQPRSTLRSGYGIFNTCSLCGRCCSSWFI